MPLFVRKTVVINKENVRSGKPLLLASNHSGSFFDAVVLGVHLPQQIHTFTRADVFRKPSVARWLRRINLIPAYRGTEGGREHLLKNEASFRVVKQMFKKHETIVIFSEGICVNEWRLRPLAKGTARLAWQTWFGENPQRDMEVVPTGVTYEHFCGAGKRLMLCFGEPVRAESIKEDPENPEKWLREFTEVLTERMRGAILETPDGRPFPGDMDPHFAEKPAPVFLKAIGTAGRLMNRPIYRLYTTLARKMTKGTVFYDSVLFGTLIYTYPLLIGLVSLLAGLLFGWYWGIALFVGIPFLGRLGNRYR